MNEQIQLEDGQTPKHLLETDLTDKSTAVRPTTDLNSGQIELSTGEKQEIENIFKSKFPD